MSRIRFVPGKYDGEGWSGEKHPDLFDLVYMHVTANDHTFSGWVSPEVRRVVLAAPANQRAVYAHEAMIGRLKVLLDADDLDGARDLVKAEYDAIHGPSDAQS